MDKVTLVHRDTGRVHKTGRRSMDKYLAMGYVLQEDDAPPPPSPDAGAPTPGLFSTDEDQDYDDDSTEEV